MPASLPSTGWQARVQETILKAASSQRTSAWVLAFLAIARQISLSASWGVKIVLRLAVAPALQWRLGWRAGGVISARAN